MNELPREVRLTVPELSERAIIEAVAAWNSNREPSKRVAFGDDPKKLAAGWMFMLKQTGLCRVRCHEPKCYEYPGKQWDLVLELKR